MIKLVGKRGKRERDETMQKLAEEWSWVADDIKEEGRVEGRVEGLEEKAADVAKKLIAEGMTIEKISAITELSAEQVDKLRISN